MRYEWDIARRYLHLPAIGRFYLSLLLLLAAAGAVYTGLNQGAIYLVQARLHQQPLFSHDPVLIVQLLGLAAGAVIWTVLALTRKHGRWSFLGYGLLVLVAAFIAQRLVIYHELLAPQPEVDVPLAFAVVFAFGSILRPTLGVPFITILTTASLSGVALGVASIIVVLSVMNGFDRDFHQKILGMKSHAALPAQHGQRSLQHWPSLRDTLLAMDETASVHPVALGLALIVGRDNTAVMVRGIDPRTEADDSFLRQAVTLGELDQLTPPTIAAATDDTELVTMTSLRPETVPVILGAELANHIFGLGVRPGLPDERKQQCYEAAIGRTVRLIAAQTDVSAMGLSTTSVVGRVAGLFRSGFYEFDNSIVLTRLDVGQYLYGLGEGVSKLEIRLHNYQPEPTFDFARAAVRTLEQDTDDYWYVSTWMEADRFFYESLVLERRMMALILSIIVLVASCSILTTLVMVVMEKTRDIGILRAVGATQRSVLFIFIVQGMLIGLLGTLTGCLLAAGVCTAIDWLEMPLPGGNSIYYIDKMPVQMELDYFVNVILYTLLISFLATLYPAHRASRLVPVEAMRYE